MFSDKFSKVTEGIRVNVRSAYLREESLPLQEHYVFAYQVQIINESPYRVQLLRRKWVITDGVGMKRVVNGEGVIGQQPVLNPGETHEYISGCDFHTPAGKMEGYYYFIRSADDSEFRVRIPQFTMFVPYLLN